MTDEEREAEKKEAERRAEANRRALERSIPATPGPSRVPTAHTED